MPRPRPRSNLKTSLAGGVSSNRAPSTTTTKSSSLSVAPRRRFIDLAPAALLSGVRRMTSRGLEGTSLPSVTSRANDNKPDGRGAAAPVYLDCEGNIRPGDPAECLSAGGVTGREARGPGDAAHPPEGCVEARGRKGATPREKYNSFNYWRRRLPDVTRELKDGRSRRLDVNGSARSPGVTGGKATPRTKSPSDQGQVRTRSQTRSLSPKPGRSPRPGTLLLCDPEQGESSTDPQPHAQATPTLDLALPRHTDLHNHHSLSEDQLILDRRRLKSGSVCDYSRLVSARPFHTLGRRPAVGHVGHHKVLTRRNSAPVDILRGLFGSFRRGRVEAEWQPPRECWPATAEDADDHPDPYGEDTRGPEYYLGDEEVFVAAATMGNIQGSDHKKGGKGKAKGKGKLAKGKSPSKGKLHGSRDTLLEGELPTPSPSTPGVRGPSLQPVSTSRPVPSERATPIITESWKEARRPESLSAGRALGGDAAVGFVDSSSSSESVFTEARSGGGPTSQHDAVTPSNGAATPMFSEALDLPIDAIMSGHYSSSDTSTVSSRPHTLAESLQSTNSALEVMEKTCRNGSQTHLDTAKKTGSSSEREKTCEGLWESGGKAPAAMHPPCSPRQVEATTDTRGAAGQYSSGLASAPLSPHTGDVLSPNGVDLEFSERDVFEVDSECEESLRLYRHGSDPHGGEESLGSFICVDLERPGGRVKAQSLGDHHDPDGLAEDTPRSFSAEDLELDPEEYLDEEYYGDDDDMPQASAGGRGGGGGSSAFKVSRHRKVELQPAKPSASRSLSTNSHNTHNNNNINATKNRALSENCITGEYTD
ncbi:hypothetical protein GWK47_036899 [Chionoecetes opilio]|uniref:APC membrane recruitment protein 2 n=1 Tax=Chionoecetes opilio TaxID=41210 RepID=A0A8J5D1N5_CHIOP|nr:hypothetical protein GWK47_036899 [Chionoecetes opilio]